MKVKNQLFGIIVIVGAALILILNFYRYQKLKEIILQSSFDHLKSISELKSRRILNLLDEKFAYGKMYSNDLLSKVGSADFSCNHDSCRKKINRVISNYLIYQLKGIIILNDSGNVIVSTDSIFASQNFLKDDLFIFAKEGKCFLKAYPYDNKSLLTFISVRLTINEKFVGVMILKALDNNIISLTKDYTGLGNSGETYIGKKSDSTYIINPSRFDHHTKKINAHDTSIAMNKALDLKRKGECYDCKDYRGVKVISSYTYIPQIGWGIVTEMDRDEIFIPLRKATNLLIVLAVLSVFLVAFISYILGSYFSKPLERLIGYINKFKQGNLSVRSDINMNNEIGILSDSFNEMASTIENNMTQLHKSNEALNKFGYTISHDLKGPVQNIYSLAEMIKEEYKDKQLSGEGIQMMGMLSGKAKLMEEMINNVLHIAKSGKKFQERNKFNSRDIALQAINNLNVPSHVKIYCSENLPEVFYNKTALLQIFLNLISNAVKYNDKREGIVQIYSEEMKDKFSFIVKDNGKGIEEKYFNQIFNIFSNVNDEHSKVESSGIGLSTVKEILTENNGEIWVESKPGEGSAFYFTIPKI